MSQPNIAVLTAAASAELDATSPEPVEILMERAGLGVALAAVDMGMSYGRWVVILAGPGNNGGDGYVAARYLRNRGVAVEVLQLAEPRTRAAQWALGTAAASGVPIRPWRSPKTSDLVIDALFGAGFRGEIPASVHPWIETSGRLLAVDVPSGLDATTGRALGRCFSAERTVTFHSAKTGHFVGIGPDVTGQLDIVDIGLKGGEAEFHVVGPADAPRPIRNRSSHKWSAGAVMVVGGVPGMTGAAQLAARSALNGGAGAVCIAASSEVHDLFAVADPGILTKRLSEELSPRDAIDLIEASQRYDVLVLGPGLGLGREGFVRVLLERWNKPLVLDADGLNSLDGPDLLVNRTAPTVITPHATEFKRLTNAEPGYQQAADLAAQSGMVVLLKGNPTFIAGEELWMVRAGGPELATIGTGDVLAGLVAAFIAAGLEPEIAARSAAYWHGRAGQSLSRRRIVTAETLAAEVGSLGSL